MILIRNEDINFIIVLTPTWELLVWCFMVSNVSYAACSPVFLYIFLNKSIYSAYEYTPHQAIIEYERVKFFSSEKKNSSV